MFPNFDFDGAFRLLGCLAVFALVSFIAAVVFFVMWIAK